VIAGSGITGSVIAGAVISGEDVSGEDDKDMAERMEGYAIYGGDDEPE